MNGREALRTSEEYREALKRMKPSIIKDRLLENPYDDEDIRKGMNVVALSYDLARDERYREMMTVTSPFTGRVINRFNHIPFTKEDMRKKQQMIHTLAREVFCAQRCVGGDALHTLFVGTYKVDKSNKFETDYHERFKKYLNKEGMIVFNNVFVPRERVFMCGEYRFAATFANMFANLHRFAYTACKPAVYENMTGAAMLISEYNGTRGEYFLSNNSEKTFDIYKTAITVRGLCKAAIEDAYETESGAMMPDPIYANMGKYISSENFHKAISTLQDMAGGLPPNLPYEELLENKDFRDRMEKLLTRRKGVSIEDQYALNELIRVMVASNEGGLLQFGSKHGGGNKEAEKVAIYGNSLRAMNACKNCIQRMSQEYNIV